MHGSCCLSMILSFFATNALVVNGAVWSGNPNTYYCSKWSPLDEPYISNTVPPVPLTHIFCGQLQIYHGPHGVQVSAEGFHSRPGNRNPKSAIIDTTNDQITILGKPVQHCPYRVKAKNVKILDAKWGRWVSRTDDPRREFIFFPPSWQKNDVVNEIINVYNTCIGTVNRNCVRYETSGRLTQICLRNYTYQGCFTKNRQGQYKSAFRVFLSWRRTGYLVVTAFPDEDC